MSASARSPDRRGMYGMIHRALQDFVCQHHCDEAWQAIMTQAGTDDASFVTGHALVVDGGWTAGKRLAIEGLTE